MIDGHTDNSSISEVGGSGQVNTNLILSGLTLNGTNVFSVTKLKFNNKPLANALKVIRQLEPVEYEQTYALVEQYNEDTPQSHHCGFIAQHVQQIEALRHAMLGGEVGEDGKDTVRCLNYYSPTLKKQYKN